MMNPKEMPPTIPQIFNKYKDIESLSLKEQYHILSVCPNYHHWCTTKKHGLKKEEYFIPTGQSPRNQIMNSILCRVVESIILPMGNPEIATIHANISEVMSLVARNIYHHTPIPQVKRRQHQTSQKRIRLNPTDILEYIGITSDEYDNMRRESEVSSSSVYKSFRINIINNGTILWRIQLPQKEVVLMNDYHADSGDFKVEYCFALCVIITFKFPSYV